MTGRRLLNDSDVEMILDEVDNRALATPSIYELEAFIEKLHRKYPVDCWVLRRHLKWLMKKVYKEYDIQMRNPYWMHKSSRLR